MVRGRPKPPLLTWVNTGSGKLHAYVDQEQLCARTVHVHLKECEDLFPQRRPPCGNCLRRLALFLETGVGKYKHRQALSPSYRSAPKRGRQALSLAERRS